MRPPPPVGEAGTNDSLGLKWTPWLKQYFGSSATQSAYVADGLSRYWLSVLDRDSFYFRSPQITEKNFLAAADKHRIEPVLKAVASGLSLSLPKWLNDMLRNQ